MTPLLPQIRSRRERAKSIQRSAQINARRSVGERTHCLRNQYYRVPARSEKKPENYIAMWHLAIGCIAYQASGLFLG